MEIRGKHSLEEKQRHGDADGEFGEAVARFGLQIASQPGEIAEPDKPEDKQDGFSKRRHFPAS